MTNRPGNPPLISRLLYLLFSPGHQLLALYYLGFINCIPGPHTHKVANVPARVCCWLVKQWWQQEKERCVCAREQTECPLSAICLGIHHV